MKTFLCVVRRVLAVLLALIFALLGAACLIAIPLSNNYSAMVSMAIDNADHCQKRRQQSEVFHQ